ncbi:MAG: 2-phospho-L-lactate guanylyltransferase [Gammaproteobacteria bacterium]|nr:2-phospho-L-lactate guanylyltransferase [Gammaproteobacteria bacterium]
MWALIPVKTFSAAKTRLAPVLAAPDRASLARTMLLDVLDALRDSPRISGIAIISREASLPALVDDYGAVLLAEPADSDLSRAVGLGLERARARSDIDTVLIVPGDIPLVQPDDVDRLAAAAADNYAICPARDEDGTNALVLPRPFRFQPAFGPGSFARHLAALRADGLAPVIHHSVGISLDIDTGADLNRLLRLDRPCRTYQLLQQIAMREGGGARFGAG